MRTQKAWSTNYPSLYALLLLRDDTAVIMTQRNNIIHLIKLTLYFEAVLYCSLLTWRQFYRTLDG